MSRPKQVPDHAYKWPRRTDRKRLSIDNAPLSAMPVTEPIAERPLGESLFAHEETANIPPHSDSTELARHIKEEYGDQHVRELADYAATVAADAVIGRIGDAYRSPIVNNAARDAARAATHLALGLDTLPQEQEGEQ